MNKSKEQVTRIRQMEHHLNTALAAVHRMEAALDQWEAAQDAMIALNEYYGSQAWHQDLADDEAGLLPKDLKRGVLSQDAIWNLLTDVHDLTTRLQSPAVKDSHIQ